MAEEKLISVSVQLPASELSRLSELVNRILRVMDSDGTQLDTGAPPAVEHSDSTYFDLAQFRALRQAATPAKMEVSQGETAPMQERAERGTADFSSQPGGTRLPVHPADASAQGEAPIPRKAPEAEEQASVPTPSPDATESPAAGSPAADTARNPESLDVPGPDRDRAPRQEAAAPIRREPLWSQEEAPAAGFPIAGMADTPSVKVPDSGRHLVSAGPAPLTAQAVSLAFERDDRRYDNGFPLY